MSTLHTPVLFISGPVGLGKSTIANEVGSCLEQMDIAHTVIDYDNLADTWPRLTDDPWGDRLGRANLRDVWRNCAAAGAKNLIIAHVVEQRAWVNEVCTLIPRAAPTLCLLMADDTTLASRVQRRELGAGRAWHMNRAFELARQFAKDGPADFVMKTDGVDVEPIAREIAQRVVWER